MECYYTSCQNQAEIICSCVRCIYLCQKHVKTHLNDNITIIHDTDALYSQIWKAKCLTENFIPKRKSDYQLEPESTKKVYLIRNYKPKIIPKSILINFSYQRHQRSPKALNLEFEKKCDIKSPQTILYTSFSLTQFVMITQTKASFYNLSNFTIEKSIDLPTFNIYDQGNRTMSPNCKWLAEELCVWEFKLRKRCIYIISLFDGSVYDKLCFEYHDALRFSSCSTYLAAGVLENSLILYKIKTKEIISIFHAYPTHISSIEWQKYYMFCWGGTDQIFCIWDIKNQILIYKSKDKEYLSSRSCWSLNLKYIIMGNNNGEILKFNCMNHKIVKHQALQLEISNCKWGKQDDIIIVTGLDMIKIFDSKNFDLLYSSKSSLQQNSFASISPSYPYISYSIGCNMIRFLTYHHNLDE